MSIDQIGKEEFARRNLWEATLLDENGKDIVWSTGLIHSINIPKLSLTVEDIYAGTSKGYTGWKLPDNLTISIWETSDHTVEKYLDEWMIGKTGVLNTGDKDDPGVRFRVQKENCLYRDVRVTTFIYKYSEDDLDEETVGVVGGVKNKVKLKEYTHAENKKFSDDTKRMGTKQNSIYVPEITMRQKILTVDNKQVIPGLDKVTAAIGGLANQATARIPLIPGLDKFTAATGKLGNLATVRIPSDITRRFIPPVVIPPLLMNFPASTGTPFPLQFSSQGKTVRLHDNIKPSKKDLDVSFTGGETTHARRWKASEKATSVITYSTAIEGYDIGTYDYSTGDGVSYTVNLAVRDIKIEYLA